MLRAVRNVGDWASNGARRLDDSINGDINTKEAVLPLLGQDGYEDKAKDVRGKAVLCEGPHLALSMAHGHCGLWSNIDRKVVCDVAVSYTPCRQVQEV